MHRDRDNREYSARSSERGNRSCIVCSWMNSFAHRADSSAQKTCSTRAAANAHCSSDARARSRPGRATQDATILRLAITGYRGLYARIKQRRGRDLFSDWLETQYQTPVAISVMGPGQPKTTGAHMRMRATPVGGRLFLPRLRWGVGAGSVVPPCRCIEAARKKGDQPERPQTVGHLRGVRNVGAHKGRSSPPSDVHLR